MQGAAVGEVPFGFVVPSPALSLVARRRGGGRGRGARDPAVAALRRGRATAFFRGLCICFLLVRRLRCCLRIRAPAPPARRGAAPRGREDRGLPLVPLPPRALQRHRGAGRVLALRGPEERPPRVRRRHRASFMLKRPAPAAAVHELDVVTPAGRVAALQVRDRDGRRARGGRRERHPRLLPLFSSSSPGSGSPPSPLDSWRRRGVLSPSPPGTRPGEPLLVANHVTGLSVDALDPPAADSNASSSASSPSLFPSWAGPLVLLAVAGDAASALADPSLPLALAAAAAGAAAAAQAGRSVVLPALRRLPESAVGVEASRSGLLAQHVALTKASDAAARGAAEDARALARLWALRAKMDSVSAAARASASASSSLSSSSSAFLDGGDGGETDAGDGSFVGDGDEYAERGGRVEAAAAALERRL